MHWRLSLRSIVYASTFVCLVFEKRFSLSLVLLFPIGLNNCSGVLFSIFFSLLFFFTRYDARQVKLFNRLIVISHTTDVFVLWLVKWRGIIVCSHDLERTLVASKQWESVAACTSIISLFLSRRSDATLNVWNFHPQHINILCIKSWCAYT